MFEWEFIDGGGGGGGGGFTPTTEVEFFEDVQTITAGTGATISTSDLDLVADDDWDEFIMGLLGFFGTTSGGADQNSYYNDHSDEAPLGEYFIQEWGWLPSVRQMPGYHFFDYLTQNIDPEFLQAAFAVHTMEDIFRDNGGSLNAIEGVPLMFYVGGTPMLVTWHSGTAPGANGSTNPNDSNEILVTANLGYFTVAGQNPGPSTGNDPPPSVFDLMDMNTSNMFNNNFRDLQQALQYLDDSPLAVEIMRSAHAAGVKVVIVRGTTETGYHPASNTVFWNPEAALRLTNGGLMSPAMALLHELAHGALGLPNTPTGDAYDDVENRYIIQHYEWGVAAVLGEPTRQDHRGTFVFGQTDVTHREPAPGG